MRGKVARKIRQLLQLKQEGDYYISNLLPVGDKEIAVIDGVDGNHRIENREVFRHYSSNNRKLYRRLKIEYTIFSGDISSTLKKDLKEFKQNK